MEGRWRHTDIGSAGAPLLPETVTRGRPAVDSCVRLANGRGGEIEAVDEREAIEIAAKEFKQPAKKLMAVQRP